MGQDLFAAKGNTSDAVTVTANAPASPVPTPIMEISPERGLFLRILNAVAKGEMQGIPVYADLRDSNGDPLPINTTLFFALEPNGHTLSMKVSEKVESIDQYQMLSLSEQRNVDNVDSVKVTLQHPEPVAKGGNAADYIDVRDIDTLYLMCDSPVAIDWSQSSFYFESEAIQQKSRGN